MCSAGCLLGCARQARRKGCLEISKSTMGSRVVSPSPSPTLLFSMRRGAESVRAFGQTMSVVYKEYALSCWSLLACRLLVSLVGILVARLGCIPTLTRAFIVFSHQCRYDHPRATTSIGTSDLLSAFARCLRSALLPSFESNGCRPLTLLPFSGSSVRSLLGALYKRSSGLRPASRLPCALLSLSLQLGLASLLPRHASRTMQLTLVSFFYINDNLFRFRYGSDLCS
jgi:hypothetical protein